MARHEKQLQDFFAAAQEYPRDLELFPLPRAHSREADRDSGSGPRPFRAPYALRIRQGVCLSFPSGQCWWRISRISLSSLFDLCTSALVVARAGREGVWEEARHGVPRTCLGGVDGVTCGPPPFHTRALCFRCF